MSAVRIAVNNLAGVPSIVFGVFGLGFFVYVVGGAEDQNPSPAVLADYDKLLKARGGLALAQVIKPNFCGGCRMTVTPQRLQELRAQSALLPCESCGRYLYWPS